MKSYDDNFKIGIKAKKLFTELYDLTENIPRKDAFLRDQVKNKTFDLLETIYLLNSAQKPEPMLHELIKTNLALIDFLLETLYNKKYLSLKQLDRIVYLLKEITKMTAKWKPCINE